MSRTLPSAAISALVAAETDEAYLVLLTIGYDGGYVYLSSDSVNTVKSGGDEYLLKENGDYLLQENGYRIILEQSVGTGPTQTYAAFPFDITLPVDKEGQISTAQLRIDNVSQALIDNIRNQATPLTVSIEVVLASDLSTMALFEGFYWRGLSYDAVSISGQLTMETFLNEPFSDIMSAKDFPGLF